MYFSFPWWFNRRSKDVVGADYLQQEEVHKKFMFRLNSIFPIVAIITIRDDICLPVRK